MSFLSPPTEAIVRGYQPSCPTECVCHGWLLSEMCSALVTLKSLIPIIQEPHRAWKVSRFYCEREFSHELVKGSTARCGCNEAHSGLGHSVA